MISSNIVVTYSFLAHINNTSDSISDLSDVYIPLIKRVLAKNSSRFTQKGQLSEIKELVDKEYGINMPFSILRKIVVKIAEEMNNGKHIDFIFFGDGAFIIKKNAFSNYDEIIKEQEEEISNINLDYENYLIDRGFNPKEQLSLFDFLDMNRATISSFFSGEEAYIINNKYIIQAEYARSVKNDRIKFGILTKIYLGSIISAYLESNYGVTVSGIELVLDTNFVISLLNLNSEESNHTCKYLFSIANKLGYKFTVLDITIDEIRNLLKRKAEEIEHPTLSTVFEDEMNITCLKEDIRKTDLERTAAKLEEIIYKKKGIARSNIKDEVEEIKKTQAYINMRDRRYNPEGALHDAATIYYIKKVRGSEITEFNEAKAWVVSGNINENSIIKRRDGYYVEFINAQLLLNILWLSCPSADGISSSLASNSLTRLVSTTIKSTLPNTREIKELDDNIRKYTNDISSEEIVKLANAIANKTIVNLNELNKKVTDNDLDGFRELLAYYLKEDANNLDKQKSETRELKQQLTISNEQLIIMDKRIEEITLIEQNKLKTSTISTLQLLIKTKQSTIEAYKTTLNQTIKSKSEYNISKKKIDDLSAKYSNKMIKIISFLVYVVLIFTWYIIYKVDWNKLEPIQVGIGLTLTVLVWNFSCSGEIKLSKKQIRERLNIKKKSSLADKFNFIPKNDSFYEKEIEKVCNDIKKQEDEISKIICKIDEIDECTNMSDIAAISLE